MATANLAVMIGLIETLAVNHGLDKKKLQAWIADAAKHLGLEGEEKNDVEVIIEGIALTDRGTEAAKAEGGTPTPPL